MLCMRDFPSSGVLQNPSRDDFTAFIECGQSATLGDLSGFQQQIEASEGYRQYCSQQEQKRDALMAPVESSQPPTTEVHGWRSGNTHSLADSKQQLPDQSVKEEPGEGSSDVHPVGFSNS